MRGLSKSENTKPDAARALDVLRGIVAEGSVRPGVEADAVCGVVPQLYAEPATEDELSRLLRYANESGLLVSARGSGSKLDWGATPEGVDLLISTARFNRILEYAPGDMTVTSGSGVSIAQLQSTLATHGQRLALDPLWPERATVGGIVATNDSGALRLRYGGVRDLIIGITVVLADGTVAASGGKVVKNVAGYDLPKLMTGSLGTLGIIARAVFRLHPLPENSQTLTWRFPNSKRANEFMLAIADSRVLPTGLQLRTSGLRMEAPGEIQVDVRVDGIAAGIAAQFDSVRKLAGDVSCAAPLDDPWQAREQLWHAADSASTLIVKLSVLPNQLAVTAGFVRRELGDAEVWRLLMNSTGLAWLRVEMPRLDAEEFERMKKFVASLRAFLALAGGTAVLLQVPSPLRGSVDVWGGVGSALPLMRSLKQQFDPRAILNRARFVGGI